MIDTRYVDVALGYDPGGDGRHGVAAVHLDRRAAPKVECETVQTAERAASWLAARLPRREGSLAAIGIDTLTVWSTGSAGWRPADAWLRETYPSVRNSVAAPNSLFGSMAIGGIGVLVALREYAPSLVVSETHPKVLYFALAQEKYAFDADVSSTMSLRLRAWTGWERSRRGTTISGMRGRCARASRVDGSATCTLCRRARGSGSSGPPVGRTSSGRRRRRSLCASRRRSL